MPYSPAEGNPQFQRQFDELSVLAQQNATSRNPGDICFNVTSNGPGDYTTQIWRIETAIRDKTGERHQLAPKNEEPAWLGDASREVVSLEIAYRKLEGEAPPVSTIQTSRTVPHLHGRRAYPIHKDENPAVTMDAVCIKWCGVVDTFPDLGKVTKAYISHIAQPQFVEPQGVHQFSHLSLIRSLVLASEHNLSYAYASPYLEALVQADTNNEKHQELLYHVGLSLGNILLKQERANMKLAPIVTENLILEAVQQFEGSNLLPHEWWLRTGFAQMGAIVIPQLLTGLHKKLGESGIAAETLAGSLSPRLHQQNLEHYIARLLSAYSAQHTDNPRDTEATRKITRLVVDKKGKADLKLLISIANGIIRDQNEASGTDNPKLDPEDLRSLGDALLVILPKTIPQSATSSAWEKLSEQDILHAEILDTLHNLMRGLRTQAIDEQLLRQHVRLRYPSASEVEQSDIRGRLSRGAPYAVVRAHYRAKRRAASTRAQGVRKPGKGLLS